MPPFATATGFTIFYSFAVPSPSCWSWPHVWSRWRLPAARLRQSQSFSAHGSMRNNRLDVVPPLLSLSKIQTKHNKTLLGGKKGTMKRAKKKHRRHTTDVGVLHLLEALPDIWLSRLALARSFPLGSATSKTSVRRLQTRRGTSDASEKRHVLPVNDRDGGSPPNLLRKPWMSSPILGYE